MKRKTALEKNNVPANFPMARQNTPTANMHSETHNPVLKPQTMHRKTQACVKIVMRPPRKRQTTMQKVAWGKNVTIGYAPKLFGKWHCPTSERLEEKAES